MKNCCSPRQTTKALQVSTTSYSHPTNKGQYHFQSDGEPQRSNTSNVFGNWERIVTICCKVAPGLYNKFPQLSQVATNTSNNPGRARSRMTRDCSVNGVLEYGERQALLNAVQASCGLLVSQTLQEGWLFAVKDSVLLNFSCRTRCLDRCKESNGAKDIADKDAPSN